MIEAHRNGHMFGLEGSLHFVDFCLWLVTLCHLFFCKVILLECNYEFDKP
jgi:hypothetical protein